jgi:hypothetical protein
MQWVGCILDCKIHDFAKVDETGWKIIIRSTKVTGDWPPVNDKAVDVLYVFLFGSGPPLNAN